MFFQMWTCSFERVHVFFMPQEKFHTVGDIRSSVADLRNELEALSRQREFLLSRAIPKLEHEYLYCIAVLEREAATLEAELSRLSTIISFYETALQNNVPPEYEKLSATLIELSKTRNDTTPRQKHKYSDDHSIIPVLESERDEISSLYRSILKRIASLTTSEQSDQQKHLLKRLSQSYQTGNIAELRALRIIIEGKRSTPIAADGKKSFLSGQFLVIRFRASMMFQHMLSSSFFRSKK